MQVEDIMTVAIGCQTGVYVPMWVFMMPTVIGSPQAAQAVKDIMMQMAIGSTKLELRPKALMRDTTMQMEIGY